MLWGNSDEAETVQINERISNHIYLKKYNLSHKCSSYILYTFKADPVITFFNTSKGYL